MDTRGQSRNKAWKEQRRLRMTSSNFGTICKATERRNIVALCENILSPKDLKSPSLEYGRKYEAVAIEKYEQLYKLTTNECGLFISTTYPFLAASPDRLEGDDIVVEVKCPYVARDMDITSVTVPYLESYGDALTLKKNHDYYYQIQGQLLCTGRSKARLVVFSTRDIKVIDISYDALFVKAMTEKLEAFYMNHFRSAVLNKAFFRQYYHCSFHIMNDWTTQYPDFRKTE